MTPSKELIKMVVTELRGAGVKYEIGSGGKHTLITFEANGRACKIPVHRGTGSLHHDNIRSVRSSVRRLVGRTA
jgi:hypothetical protein